MAYIEVRLEIIWKGGGKTVVFVLLKLTNGICLNLTSLPRSAPKPPHPRSNVHKDSKKLVMIDSNSIICVVHVFYSSGELWRNATPT